MGVTKGIAFFVADGFEELVDPDGGVDGEAFAVEGGEVGWAGTGLEDGPEAIHTHGGCLLGVVVFFDGCSCGGGGSDGGVDVGEVVKVLNEGRC